MILSFMWKYKELKIAKTILKENKVGRLILLDLRITLKLQQSRQCEIGVKTDKIGQWNRIENLEIGPHIYGQLNFNKITKWINSTDGDRTFRYPYPHTKK